MTWLFSKALMQDYENSRCSQGQEAESSEVTCSDGEPYAQLNVMPTLHKFWRNDKMIESSHLSRFGLTLRLLTEDHGETVLMWYLEDSHAKTYRLPEKAQVLRVGRDRDYGATKHASFAKWSQSSGIWKTAQHLLFEDLELSLETWPRWGLMRNGECFHAKNAAVFTYEKESGFSLPTPRSCSAMAMRITSKTASYKNPNLETGLARLMLPTLGANEGKGASKNRYLNSPDFRGAKMCEGLRTCESDPIYLNPLFAELTMMWPLGWTDLKPLAMDKFREWQQQHGGFLVDETK